MSTATQLVHRYFDLAPSQDTDAYFARFTDDVVVEDDGHEYHGVAAVRAWRHSAPAVSYSVRDVEAVGTDHVAHAEVAGDFPGSPVLLTFQFEFTANAQISHLTIRL